MTRQLSGRPHTVWTARAALHKPLGWGLILSDDAEQVKVSRWQVRRPGWINLATAGFIMSVTLALINAFYAIRGAEIVVMPPEQVLLYRDGEGERSVLNLAVRLATINAADSSHGDVLMDAGASFPGRDARFAYTAEVKPVFGDTNEAEGCERGAHCVILPGLEVTEQGDGILDVPGGGVRNLYASFALTEWNCEGKACATFGDAGAAAGALAGKQLAPRITLKFFDDGRRRIDCETGGIDLAYLAKTGWISLACTRAKVSGDNWL